MAISGECLASDFATFTILGSSAESTIFFRIDLICILSIPLSIPAAVFLIKLTGIPGVLCTIAFTLSPTKLGNKRILFRFFLDTLVPQLGQKLYAVGDSGAPHLKQIDTVELYI